MKEIICPLCSGEEVIFYLQRKDGLSVFQCNSCNLKFVSQKALENLYGGIENLYEEEYYEDKGDLGYSKYDVIPVSNFLWQSASIQLIANISDMKSYRCLDVGCGTGRLMELLMEKGIEVEGIEMSGHAADVASSRGLKVINKDIMSITGESSYDTIVAFDVMEHIPDIKGFFTKIYYLIKEDGVFIFLTPDAGAERAMVEKERWYGYNSSLEHLYYFSIQSLRFIFSRVFGSEPVLYQASAHGGEGIFGFIRKKTSDKDTALRKLFVSNFSSEFVNKDNVIPVCILLKTVNDRRFLEYANRYHDYISANADEKELLFIMHMTTSFKELIKTLEFPFCYYAYVIAQEGLVDYFHYGLWETGTKGLKEAQENLASMIKSLIPKEVKRILDVGCGLGRTTRDLLELGYDVIGISTDEKLMEMARAKYTKYSPALIISSFEDYKSTSLFDLILFQESAQYIKNLKFLFSHCKELLNKTGYVLICDEVRYENSNDTSFHGKKEIVKTAGENNFNVLLNEDITQKVLKTRSFGLKFILENKGLIISEFSPIRKNAQQEIEFLIEGWKKHSSMFEQNVFGYEIFLFQKNEPLNIESSISPVGTVNEETKGTSMSKGTSTIRLYEKGDEHGIVKLFKDIFGREMTLDEWRWKYIESHPQKVYSSVAVHKELGIVGHYGGVCLPILYNGNLARGLAICDVMIHPRFRGLKTLKELSWLVPHEAVKDGLIIGYGFPNKNTLLKPALKMGIYEKVEDVIEGNREAKFHNNLNRYNFKLFPLDYSDPRIDHLWESCKNNLKLAVVRDREYLSWRYKHHPLFTYELWGLKKRIGKRLYGLAVLKKEEHRVLIMDFLFAKGMLRPLFQKLENYASSAGIKTITLWAPPFTENTLIESGFLIQSAGTSIPRTTHDKTLTKEQIRGNFFYTMGDTDFL